MSGDVEEAIQGLSELSLGTTQGRTFLECAVERVTTVFGDQWRDQGRMVDHRWPSDNKGEEKIGDKAEEATLNSLADPDFCKLLGEPLFILSGKFLPKGDNQK